MPTSFGAAAHNNETGQTFRLNVSSFQPAAAVGPKKKTEILKTFFGEHFPAARPSSNYANILRTLILKE